MVTLNVDYYEMQKQMFEVLKQHQKELLEFEIKEIEKLEQAEVTENRLKAIRNRKKRVEDFYELLKMYEDVHHYMDQSYQYAMREMQFFRESNTMYQNANLQWIEIYKKKLHEKN